jgi:hypothetical protein
MINDSAWGQGVLQMGEKIDSLLNPSDDIAPDNNCSIS